MKKWLFVFLFFLSIAAAAYAEEEEGKFPWNLTMFAGGAKLCDENGCFGPNGLAAGLAFGRQFTPHWSFELDGTWVRSTINEVPRFDEATGIFFIPQLQRTRVWGGATFLRTMKHFGSRSDLFIAVGAVGAFERQTEKVPPEIFPLPSKNLGVKGGVSGGAGLNLWFSRTWGIRPEARFYAVATPLSGLRYTAGLIHQFQ